MTIVCDSGPLIHLAQVDQFYLLKEFFQELEINQAVYDEVVIEGKNRAGEKELIEALAQGWANLAKFQDQSLIERTTGEGLSRNDASVLALAIEKKTDFLVSDDPQVRKVALEKGIRITGTVGILTNARLKGLIPNIKILLDKLINQGFHLNPQGPLYKDALKIVGEE